jgi:hypothetical protein
MPITEHAILLPANPKAIVWRYISIEKLKSLFEDKALFFCRADKFSDIFEGSLPLKENEWRIERYRQRCEKSSKEFILEEAQKYSDNYSSMYKRQRTGTIVNCWHLNVHENSNMWGAYLKDTDGVAIRTTVEELTSSINHNSEKIYASRVRYLDYLVDAWYDESVYPIPYENSLIPLIHKRKEFAGELEFRLFNQIEEAKDEDYWEGQSNQRGRLISCDIAKMIQQIVVHPNMGTASYNLVKELLDKHGILDRIASSSLIGKVYF